MSTVRLDSIGRFGNLCFQVAHALSFCEQGGHELRMPKWVGEHIFTLGGYIPKRPDGTEDIVLSGYFQNQGSLIYSRADCLRWFVIKPEIVARVRGYGLTGADSEYIHCHQRVGDYRFCNYPIVGKPSYEKACREQGYFPQQIEWVTEENPFRDPYFDGRNNFIPDFLRMMYAPVLFRGNSSLSWWAHAASPIEQRVFSPVITGLAGGVEHDNVPFVEGNHSRLAELPGITELHLRET